MSDTGVGQILDAYSCGEQDSIIISVGDVASSNYGYIEPLYNKDNLIFLTTDRKNRAIYAAFSGDQKKFVRKRCYGKKVNLIQENTQLIADNVTAFDNASKKGVVTKVVLREYRNFLVKRRNPHSMKDKAVNCVKAEIYMI